MNLHPDDVLFFHEVVAAMRRVAKKYDLPLRSVSPEPNPEAPCHLGTCSVDGCINLVFRFQVDGEWTEPRRPEDVWKTAAHELAHLKHFNHGVKFQEFEEELREAMENQQEDHRQKVLRKLIKMQECRDGEAKLGNSAAAEAFAAMINKMLIENELRPSDVDYARAGDDDPVIEVKTNLDAYKIPKAKMRLAWMESLARVVAGAHLCRHLVSTHSNNIWFVGTRSHALVAEYAFGTLVRAAWTLADQEYVRYYRECAKAGDSTKAQGFRPAWKDAFVGRIRERFDEAREQAIKEVTMADGVPADSSTTALVRLNGAMTKVAGYIDDKFGKRRKYISALNGGRDFHAEGRARGRAAADRMTIGRRAVTTATRAALGTGQ